MSVITNEMMLEVENATLKSQLEKAQVKAHMYYNLYIVSKHAHFVGSHPEDTRTLLDAVDEWMPLEDAIEAYTNDEDIRKAENLIRKRAGISTFYEEWKEKFGADFPEVKDE